MPEKCEDVYVRVILTVHNASVVQAIQTEYNWGDFSDLIGGWDIGIPRTASFFAKK